MAKQPGLSLADLAAMSENVPIGTSFITVHGISAKDALGIFKRFPALAKMLGGFDVATFIQVAPDAVAAILAAATAPRGTVPSEADEEAAGNVPVEVQYDMLEVIGRLTFKNGFAPFVQRITSLAGGADSGNSIKVPAMNSPPASKPASQPDIPQT
jgi:hypothetical protein